MAGRGRQPGQGTRAAPAALVALVSLAPVSLGRFMALTETQGAYCAHPLGGCRMAESPDLGAVDDTGAVWLQGLYCIDGSIVQTSLGVNPSLTISALSKRCAERLVTRDADFGLPARPASLRPAVPPEHVGQRVVPHRPTAKRRDVAKRRQRRRRTHGLANRDPLARRALGQRSAGVAVDREDIGVEQDAVDDGAHAPVRSQPGADPGQLPR